MIMTDTDEEDDISITSTLVDPNERFLVEDILAEREEDDTIQYLTKWADYDIDSCTWEPESSFQDDDDDGETPAKIAEWRATKLRIASGDEQPFDIEAIQIAIEQREAAKLDRDERRQRKKERIRKRRQRKNDQAAVRTSPIAKRQIVRPLQRSGQSLPGRLKEPHSVLSTPARKKRKLDKDTHPSTEGKYGSSRPSNIAGPSRLPAAMQSRIDAARRQVAAHGNRAIKMVTAPLAARKRGSTTTGVQEPRASRFMNLAIQNSHHKWANRERAPKLEDLVFVDPRTGQTEISAQASRQAPFPPSSAQNIHHPINTSVPACKELSPPTPSIRSPDARPGVPARMQGAATDATMAPPSAPKRRNRGDVHNETGTQPTTTQRTDRRWIAENVMCRSWWNGSSCRYGMGCRYAHRPADYISGKQNRVCSFWRYKGTCKYSASDCGFHHDLELHPDQEFEPTAAEAVADVADTEDVVMGDDASIDLLFEPAHEKGTLIVRGLDFPVNVLFDDFNHNFIVDDAHERQVVPFHMISSCLAVDFMQHIWQGPDSVAHAGSIFEIDNEIDLDYRQIVSNLLGDAKGLLGMIGDKDVLIYPGSSGAMWDGIPIKQSSEGNLRFCIFLDLILPSNHI